MLRSDNDFKNDDDSNLSDMINEYSQDNELRRKIDKLKKQKEENLRRKVDDDVYRNSTSSQSNFNPVKEVKKEEKVSSIPDIRYDNTMIDKTRVGFQPEDDSDKTLVIMNRKQGGFDFQQEKVIEPKPLYEDEDDKFYVDEDEEEVDATQEHTFTLDEDNDNEDETVYEYENDNDDEDEDDKRSNVKDDADNRINKIITGVIVGIVGLCVIAGAFFGIKYLLGSGSDTDKKKDPVETETKEPDKEPETPTTDADNKTENPDITNNDAKISKIKGTIKTLEGELASVKTKISQAESKESIAERGKETTSSDLNKAIANYGTTRSEKEKADTVLSNAKTALDYAKKTLEEIPEGADNTQAMENLRITESAYEKAKADYESKEKAFKAAEADNKEKNASYEPKMSGYDKEITQAKEELDKLKKQKTEIEQKIAAENTKLNEIH